MRSMSRTVLVATAVAGLTMAQVAIADDPAAAAKAHLAACMKALEGKQLDLATVECEQAYKGGNICEAAYGLAGAARQAGKPLRAHLAYGQYLSCGNPTEQVELRKLARQAVAELDRELGHFAFDVSPDGARVEVDGEVVTVGGPTAPVTVTPGKHKVRVSKAGHDDKLLDALDARAGATTPVVVKLPLKCATGTAPTADGKCAAVLPECPEGKPRGAAGQCPADEGFKHWPSTLTGVGALAVAGGGAFFGLRAISQTKSYTASCDPGPCVSSDRDSAKSSATLSNVFFGLAGATALTAVVLRFTVENQPEKGSTTAWLMPQPGGAMVGFALQR